MERKAFPRRTGFEDAHTNMAFHHHSVKCDDGQPYWTEGVAYEFTLREVELIEEATDRLHAMCMETVEQIVTSGDYPTEYRLTDDAKRVIEASWRCDDMHVYGRFDLMFDPVTDAVKMYEYNADTPTALPEAAIAQWQWLEDVCSEHDQFNSIHEKLIERWREARGDLGSPTLHLFASTLGQYEDWGNVEYIADTALQAGWNVHIEDVETIGYDRDRVFFVDRTLDPIEFAFKLYPWEWMMDDPFGPCVRGCPTQWFEPPWKMLLSNKALLAVLWSRYPDHPNLLPAYFESVDGYIRKPILGREGANVQRNGELLGGSHYVPEYDDGYVYQEFCPLPEIQGQHPVIGSWMIGDKAAGMGIREDAALTSGNGSHFVPHYFLN